MMSVPEVHLSFIEDIFRHATAAEGIGKVLPAEKLSAADFFYGGALSCWWYCKSRYLYVMHCFSLHCTVRLLFL